MRMLTLRPRKALPIATAVGIGVFLAVATSALEWSRADTLVVGVALVVVLALFGTPFLLLDFEQAAVARPVQVELLDPRALAPKEVVGLPVDHVEWANVGLPTVARVGVDPAASDRQAHEEAAPQQLAYFQSALQPNQQTSHNLPPSIVEIDSAFVRPPTEGNVESFQQMRPALARVSMSLN